MNNDIREIKNSNGDNNTKLMATLKILTALLIFSGFFGYFMAESTTVPAALAAAGLIMALGITIYNFNYIANKMRTRSFKYSTNALIYGAVIIAIVVLLNFIAGRDTKQWDMTSNKRYSLAEQSVKAIARLKSDINVYLFYRDIPEVRRHFSDLMKQYSYNNPKFKYEFVDMNKKPLLAKEFNITRDGITVVKYEGKTEKLENFFGEQELTNAIIRATSKEKNVIYFLEGHNEADINSDDKRGMSLMKQELANKNFELQKLNLLQRQEVPGNCSALVIAGPQIELMETEEAMISKYLDNGGHALFLVDVNFPPQAPSASMERLLSKYGIEPGKNIIIDMKPALKMLGLGDYTMPLGMIYNSDHPVVKGFNMATFYPLARAVNSVKNMPTGMTAAALVQTSPDSFADTTYLTDKNVKFDSDRDIKGPITVVTAVSKTVANAEIHSGTGENAIVSDANGRRSKQKEMRIIAAGTSNFMRNEFIGLQGNFNLALNMFSYLADIEDLIAVTPKAPVPFTLDFNQKAANNVWFIVILLVPGIVILTGFTVWYYRS